MPQLLDDPAPLVREAAARNLARLIHLLSSHDKYAAVETACLRLASDDADDVVSALLTEVRLKNVKGGLWLHSSVRTGPVSFIVSITPCTHSAPPPHSAPPHISLLHAQRKTGEIRLK